MINGPRMSQRWRFLWRDPSRYDDKGGFFKEQPDKKSYELASKCRVKGYAHVAQNLSQMKVPWAPKMPAPLQIDV